MCYFVHPLSISVLERPKGKSIVAVIDASRDWRVGEAAPRRMRLQWETSSKTCLLPMPMTNSRGRPRQRFVTFRLSLAHVKTLNMIASWSPSEEQKKHFGIQIWTMVNCSLRWAGYGLRKNVRIAISRKRNFRSTKTKNGDLFHRPNYPPKSGKTHLRNHFRPLESGFSAIATYKMRVFSKSSKLIFVSRDFLLLT